MKKLKITQMEKIQGGDYCGTLALIASHNCLGTQLAASAAYGWRHGGCGSRRKFWRLAAQGAETC